VTTDVDYCPVYVAGGHEFLLQKLKGTDLSLRILRLRVEQRKTVLPLFHSRNSLFAYALARGSRLSQPSFPN